MRFLQSIQNAAVNGETRELHLGRTSLSIMLVVVVTTSLLLHSGHFVLSWSPLLICGSALYYAFYMYLVSPLARIPSMHWSTPLLGLHLQWTLYYHGRRSDQYNRHLAKDGKDSLKPVIRVAPNEVSILSIQGLRMVYDGGFDRTGHYAVFQNFGRDTMFSFEGRQQHAGRKRIFAMMYSKTNVCQAGVQRLIRTRVAKVVDFISKQTMSYGTTFGDVNKSRPLLVRNVLRVLQTDILSAFAFSESGGTSLVENLGRGTHSTESLGLDAMDLFLEDQRDKIYFWETTAPFKYLLRWVSRDAAAMHSRAERWMLDLIDGYWQQIRALGDCAPKWTSSPLEESLYGRLVSWKARDTGRPLDWQTRASEAMDHVGAGQDSVPASIEFIMQQLSKHPAVLDRLQHELEAAKASLSSDATFATLDALPYLNAVVLEGMRLVDTFESYQPRTVPRGGCTIEGYFLPAGTIVSSHPSLMTRHPEIFADAETFDPDRWLVGTKEQRDKLLKALWVFSSGPRACIGKNLALSIIKNAVSSIYSSFSTRLTDATRELPEMFEMEFTPTTITG